MENAYRLFTGNNVSTNGEKIPLLYIKDNYKKKTIKYLIHYLSNMTSIGFYIEYEDNKVHLEIMENGNIRIRINFNKPISTNYINTILEALDKIIIKKIRTFIEKSGQQYINIKDIYSNKIQINKLKLEYNVEWNKKIDLNKYTNCLSSIFSMYQSKLSNINDVIKMKYKRVSAFKEMDEKKSL